MVIHDEELIERSTVLVTGAAGRIATITAPLLRDAFQLRRLDVRPLIAEADDEVMTADVRDVETLCAACEGVAAVIHLAAQPDEADFREDLLPRNIDATWALFEAARQTSVPRVLFASTIQTIGGYPPDVFVTPAMPPRPVSTYAATKLFGEALAQLYADTASAAVTSIRIGAVVPSSSEQLRDAQFRSFWCDPDDLAGLFVAAIKSDSVDRSSTVIAVSPPATARFDTSNSFGWQPLATPTVPELVFMSDTGAPRPRRPRPLTRSTNR